MYFLTWLWKWFVLKPKESEAETQLILECSYYTFRHCSVSDFYFLQTFLKPYFGVRGVYVVVEDTLLNKEGTGSRGEYAWPHTELEPPGFNRCCFLDCPHVPCDNKRGGFIPFSIVCWIRWLFRRFGAWPLSRSPSASRGFLSGALLNWVPLISVRPSTSVSQAFLKIWLTHLHFDW